MTIKSAKKVAKRSWPFKRFKQAVLSEAKRLGVTVNKSKAAAMQTCYDKGVTVRDTLNVLHNG